MANELSLSFSLSFSKSNATLASSASITVTVSGSDYLRTTTSIATTDTTVSLGSVGTIGYVLVKNLDSTNYVEFGSDGSVWPIKLKAGEIGLFRWNAAAFHAKANSAACIIEVSMVED